MISTKLKLWKSILIEAELETCERKKSKEIERIQDGINSHLEENDSQSSPFDACDRMRTC